jgi:phospholipase/carboxylesterase
MPAVTVALGGLEALRVESTQPPRLQVVLLHGYEMRPEDLEPFSHSLNVPATFYFPRGLLRLPSGMHCWWPIDQERRARQMQSGPRDLFEEDPAGRGAARAALIECLAAVRSGAPELPLLLGGFSQGGMLSSDTLLCGAGRAAGLVMLSSSRIAFRDWQHRSGALAGLPVLVSHGTHDPDLAFSAGEALRDFYRNSGARVTWQPFEGGHEIPLVVWRALRRFMTDLARLPGV